MWGGERGGGGREIGRTEGLVGHPFDPLGPIIPGGGIQSGCSYIPLLSIHQPNSPLQTATPVEYPREPLIYAPPKFYRPVCQEYTGGMRICMFSTPNPSWYPTTAVGKGMPSPSALPREDPRNFYQCMYEYTIDA